MRLQLRTVLASMPAVAILILIILKNLELGSVNTSVGVFVFLELIGIELLLLPLALYVAVRLGHIPRRPASYVLAVVLNLQVFGFCLAPLISALFE